MNGPIAIFSALDTELDALVTETVDAVEEPTLAGSVIQGLLSDETVILVKVGLGKVSAATMAGVIGERFGPRVMVFSGVAGGLNPDLKIGDIVIGRRTIQHDTGVIENGRLSRYQAGHLPFFNPTDAVGYRPSSGLLQRVRERLERLRLEPVLGRSPKIAYGTILTGDQFLSDPAVRVELHEELGADAIEMEGGALAQASDILEIDHLIVRSLSDLAGEGSEEDFARFVREASVNSAAVVRHILPVL